MEVGVWTSKFLWSRLFRKDDLSCLGQKYQEDNERRKEDAAGNPDLLNVQKPYKPPNSNTPKIGDSVDHHAAYLQELERIARSQTKKDNSVEEFLKQERERHQKRQQKQNEAEAKSSNEWLRKQAEKRRRIEESKPSTPPPIQESKRSTSPPASTGSSGTGCVLTIIGIIVIPVLFKIMAVSLPAFAVESTLRAVFTAVLSGNK